MAAQKVDQRPYANKQTHTIHSTILVCQIDGEFR